MHISSLATQYPNVFKDLNVIITSTIDFRLFENNVTAPDETYRVMNIISVDMKSLMNNIFKNMLECGMNFTNKTEWNDSHSIHLWVSLRKKKWSKFLTRDNFQEISAIYQNKFNMDVLYEVVHSMGYELIVSK